MDAQRVEQPAVLLAQLLSLGELASRFLACKNIVCLFRHGGRCLSAEAFYHFLCLVTFKCGQSSRQYKGLALKALVGNAALVLHFHPCSS